ncbi:hypothetical protein CV102_10860 [Natronococcus pandeyae]|uniref:Blue (type 1) copper domain-containing protein n=1 Tax=Natronococcus pandeyae TaxID=2055836 RepID=A0A8J8Q4L8_9EURY|nr:plastocyanin/azurin family copper-binding protein [Natronococcus pandeyae]TYL38308.1 hypothetical protein CV102_10860 [Natronococcus pandeyae]
MTQERDGADESVSYRRTFLTAATAGSVALAGCLSGDDDGGTDDEAENDESDGDNGGDDEESSDELHERYGYPSTSMDEEPPVDYDHEIDLLMDYPGEDEDRPPEFYFEPAGLAIEAGDVVKFNFLTPDHAVAAFHEGFGRTHRVPEGAEPLSSPMMDVDTYWLCSFEESGVYDLYCPPHEFLGMGMRLVVDEASGPATEPAVTEAEGQVRPPEEALAATFNADALEAERILEEGSVSWHDLE